MASPEGPLEYHPSWPDLTDLPAHTFYLTLSLKVGLRRPPARLFKGLLLPLIRCHNFPRPRPEPAPALVGRRPHPQCHRTSFVPKAFAVGRTGCRHRTLHHWPPDSLGAVERPVPLFHTASVQCQVSGRWAPVAAGPVSAEAPHEQPRLAEPDLETLSG